MAIPDEVPLDENPCYGEDDEDPYNDDHDDYWMTLHYTDSGIEVPPDTVDDCENILALGPSPKSYMINGTRFVMDTYYDHTIPELFRTFHRLLVETDEDLGADCILFGIELFNHQPGSRPSVYDGARVYMEECDRSGRVTSRGRSKCILFEYNIGRWSRSWGF